jgi:hypothetical protein
MNYELRIMNGEWRMENGEWRMENGEIIAFKVQIKNTCSN